MRYLLLALFFFAGQAGAEEAVKIFGIPVGGKLDRSIKVCTFDQIASDTALCFVDKPFVGKSGRKLASIKIPEKRLPDWAAYSSQSVYMKGDGSTIKISVKVEDKNLADVIASISLRFGKPTIADLVGTQIPSAIWDLDNIYIRAQQWGEKCCEVGFETPESIAETRRFVAKKSERPASP